MRDPPVAIDLLQSDGQPEQKPTRRAGAAPHDGDGEGDILAGGNCKFLDVECL